MKQQIQFRQSEKQILKAVLEYSKSIGLKVWRANTGAAQLKAKSGKSYYVHFGIAGQGDVTGILPDGRRLEIETKVPGRKQIPSQVAFQKMIEENNGIYLLIYSLDQFIKEIDEYL